MSDRAKGTAASLGAAFFAASFYIPFKAASVDNPRAAVVVSMLLCAAVLNSATWMARGSGGRWMRPVALVAVVGLAVFTILGNIGLAAALAIQEPAVTATVVHTQLFFVAVLEWIALRHRITWRFAVGAIIAIGGFAAMQLEGAGLDSANTIGVLWALLAAGSFGVMHVITRAVIARIDPVSVNALRLWLAVAVLLCVPGTAGEVTELGLEAWAFAVAAAVLGPFLSRLLLMLSVRFISASETSLINMINPLFAFVLGFAAFGTIPTGREIIGGLIILGGVMLPIWSTATARSREAP